MHRYTAETAWTRGADEAFVDHRYSRRHVLRFDGGAALPGSSSPLSVRVPYSDPAAVDPEELYVASLSSCHMLWFLSLAAQAQWRVDAYVDRAEGLMDHDVQTGKLAMTCVTLRPEVAFGGERVPTRDEVQALHHRAHEECYIANSVKSDVRCEPVFAA